MPWEKVAAIDELGGQPLLWKRSPKQIAVFQVNGDIFAVDNRCPHEGYPLAQGTVDDQCVLTCNWHNWKFRLPDGQCVVGGDNVRSYPVKQEDGHVWINTDDPPPQEMQSRILAGLHTAFRERDFGRICREIARLHFNQLDPLLAVRKAIEWSHDRLEFGTTHAYAAAADWLAEADANNGDFECQLVCLAETVDHMAFDALRHREYPYADPDEPFHLDTFVMSIESEHREAAEGMVRRALEDGLAWSDVEEAFAAAALMHYNDFGHSAIYVYKTRQSLELAGEQLQTFLLPALARHLIYTTREDLLPEFKDYAPALVACPPPGSQDAAPLDASRLRFATTRDALAWVTENIAAHRPETLYDAMLAEAARNLLHFDTSYQDAFNRPVSQNVGWLDFTHGVTFANAVRAICQRHPRFWREGLLQMALFIGRNRPYLDVELDESEWLVENRESFLAETHELLLDHGQRDPIFSAHLLKTALAVEEELPAASEPCQQLMLAGLNRFLHSPLKQKHVRRLTRQAIDLVGRDFN